jgi:hypothetical protein
MAKTENIEQNIPAIKVFIGRLIDELIEKANSLNFYCLSLAVSKIAHKHSQLTRVTQSP